MPDRDDRLRASDSSFTGFTLAGHASAQLRRPFVAGTTFDLWPLPTSSAAVLPSVVADGAAERFGDRPAFVDPDGRDHDLRRPAPAFGRGGRRVMRTRAGVRDGLGGRAHPGLGHRLRRGLPGGGEARRGDRRGQPPAHRRPSGSAASTWSEPALVLSDRPTRCADSRSAEAGRRRLGPRRRAAGDHRVHVGDDRPAEGRLVRRPSAGGGDPDRRRNSRASRRPAERADAGRNPVRPYRLHDQAGLVSAARARPPTSCAAGGPPTCSTWSSGNGFRRSAGWRRSSR